MGVYRDQVLPRLIDRACRSQSIGRWRERCAVGLHGVVVEPGFGSGLNLEFYPAEVSRVLAVDPATLGAELAAGRLAASAVPVEFVGLDGQDLAIETNSCDAALLTFTLCTIPDAHKALSELRRVLRPGAGLHFLEHGRAPTDQMVRWQHRIDPIQRRLFDGCHVSRNHPELIEAAGFEIDWHDSDYDGVRSPWSYFHIGRAVNPG